MKKNILLTLIIVVIALGSFFIYQRIGFAPSLAPVQSHAPDPDLSPNTTITLSEKGIVNAVVFDDLTDGMVISSPFAVLGKARGWYDEGTFPVELMNAKGISLFKGDAEAEGDWISGKYVPFSIQITFAKQQSGSEGTLVFSKNNSSGLSSNDDSVIVPIVFK